MISKYYDKLIKIFKCLKIMNYYFANITTNKKKLKTNHYETKLYL